MKKTLSIVILIVIFMPYCLAQKDTLKLSRDRILHEVFTTVYNSLKGNDEDSENYANYKEPFFEAYFNLFSPEELDSLLKAAVNIRSNTIMVIGY